MELLIGVFIGVFISSIIKAGWRMLNPPLPAPPQLPRNQGQLANLAAYDAEQAATPRVARIRVERRVRRGRPRRNLEDEQNPFEG